MLVGRRPTRTATGDRGESAFLALLGLMPEQYEVNMQCSRSATEAALGEPVSWWVGDPPGLSFVFMGL